MRDYVWEQLRREALDQSESEPYLASYFYATILAHPSLERSLAFHLANKLANATLLSTQLFTLFWETLMEDVQIQVIKNFMDAGLDHICYFSNNHTL